jgi:crotonobetainyl-CoA:carnitine CoA-transferase CaiB-like acyl-CoA transferase
MGGMMSVTGMPGDGPVRAGIAVADSSAGNYAAMGVLVALLEREQSGRGQWVQTNLLQSMIAMCDFQAARYLIDGAVPGQAGNDHPFATPMGTFQSADGFFNIGASGTTQFRSLCTAIERLDLRDEPRYQTNPGRLADRPYINAQLNLSFATKTTQHWVTCLNDAGVPCGPIYDMQQVFADPQVAHLGAAVVVDHEQRGPIRVVAQPIKLTRTPAAVLSSQTALGQHNEEIYLKLGFSAQDLAGLKERKVI